MKRPKHILEARKTAQMDRTPKIHLKGCRVERAAGEGGHRFIIMGNPVVAGIVPARIKIGGQTPVKVRHSPDAKFLAGLLKGLPSDEMAIVDNGFAKDSCKVEIAEFGREEEDAFKATMEFIRPAPEKSRNTGLIKSLANLLKRFFLKKNNG
jgi:hypothetical protein